MAQRHLRCSFDIFSAFLLKYTVGRLRKYASSPALSIIGSSLRGPPATTPGISTGHQHASVEETSALPRQHFADSPIQEGLSPALTTRRLQKGGKFFAPGLAKPIEGPAPSYSGDIKTGASLDSRCCLRLWQRSHRHQESKSRLSWHRVHRAPR